MAKGTIVKRVKGGEIPDAFFDKIFSELKPNAYAYIVAIDDEVLFDKGFKADLTKNDIIKMLEGHDDEMFIFLQRWESPPAEPAQLQPFELVKQEVKRADGKVEEQVFFAALAEGNFTNFHREASTNTDEFFMMLNVVQPRVDQLVDITEGDTDKITAQLKKDIIQKEFLSTPNGLGAIGIACASGDFILYAKEGQFTKYPWGEVTNSFGYKPEVEKPAVKEESMADRLRNKIKIKPKAEEPKADPVTVLKTTTVPVVKQVSMSIVEFTVPPGWKTMSNKEKKQWQNQDHGFIAGGWRNWKEGQVIKVERVLSPPDNKDLSQLDKVVAFQKDTQPHHVKTGDTLPAAASDPKPSEIGVSPLPELKAMRERLTNMDEMKALLTAGAAPIMPVSEIEKLKAKTPSFSELSGLDDAIAPHIPRKVLDKMHYEGGEAGWYMLRALIINLQISKLKQLAELEAETAVESMEQASGTKPAKIKIKRRA